MTHDELEHISEVPLAGAAGRRFRVLVRVRGEDQFVGNQLIFSTEDEAAAYARDLSARWTAVEEWRIEEVQP